MTALSFSASIRSKAEITTIGRISIALMISKDTPSHRHFADIASSVVSEKFRGVVSALRF